MSIEFHFVCKRCCNENDQLWNPTGAIPSIFTFCFDFFDFFYLGMVKCWWSTSLRSSFGWLLLVGSHSMVQRHSILSLFIWDVRSKSREFPCSMGISVCLETHRRVSESLFRTKRANVHASIQQWSHSGFFCQKNKWTKWIEGSIPNKKHRFFVSQCRLGVMKVSACWPLRCERITLRAFAAPLS